MNADGHVTRMSHPTFVISNTEQHKQLTFINKTNKKLQ